MPRLTVTVGLHGSASTWVYNVVRELLIARHGVEQVAALFRNSVEELIACPDLRGRHVVWKTHHGGPHWDAFAWLSRPIVVLSVRDPRDAACSLVQRFGMAPGPAVKGIVADCRRAMDCAQAADLTLRYEDRFFADPCTVTRLAQLIGADAAAAELQRIFAAYTTAATRDFAARLESLPPERYAGGEHPHDRVTQIHQAHIGDGQVGKWRHLFPLPQHAELTALFTPFLQRFGYPLC